MVVAVSGVPWEQLDATYPGVARLLNVETRIIGALWLGLGLLGTAISFYGLRQRKRWAWWAAWSLPLVMALVIAAFLSAGLLPGSPTPPALISGPITIIVSLAALILAYRTT
jgi:hypothetical protein